jgi:hypothetical protein
LGSLHRRLAPLRRSSSSPSSPPSRRHVRGSSCCTASLFGSPRSRVRGVVRYLAPRWRSSSCLSPCLLSCLHCAFFRKVLHLSIGNEEGGGWIFVLQNGYSLRPKMFTPFDFYKSHLTIRLIQKIFANVKIIMIYLKYILW